MSGCIDIDQKTSWMVATWAYDLALKAIMRHLDHARAPSIPGLVERASAPRVRLLSLDTAADGEVTEFLRAARLARADVGSGSCDVWDSDEARESFGAVLDDLVKKLEARLAKA